MLTGANSDKSLVLCVKHSICGKCQVHDYHSNVLLLWGDYSFRILRKIQGRICLSGWVLSMKDVMRVLELLTLWEFAALRT